mgnify:CR=1 FL=1
MPRATETIDQFDYEPQTLADRKAVVTGGTTGIGRAIALQLAADGCSVLICGRHEKGKT